MSSRRDPNEAFSRLSPRWDALRTECALAATHRHLGRRRRARTVLTALSVSVVAVSALLIWVRYGHRDVEATRVERSREVPAASSRVVRFLDGSNVELAGTQSSIEVHEVSDRQIVVELEHGDGHFRVTRRPEREFVVRAGAVSVRVVGTEFDVGRRGARTWVAVADGLVRVDWPHASATLRGGARGLFPPDDTAEPEVATNDEPEVATGAEPEVVARPPVASSASRPAPDPKRAFRDQVGRKDYAAAYRTLSEQPSVVGNSVADLMLAADVARLTGHPDRAIVYLQRVVNEHPNRPEAELAAFTAGRLYVGMGQHERAEQMFAKAGGMAPSGQLAEDALARQVLAAAKAGQNQEAQRLAREYIRRFPNGRRSAEVRKNAGL